MRYKYNNRDNCIIALASSNGLLVHSLRTLPQNKATKFKQNCEHNHT